MIRVVLVDDHPVVRDGLGALLATQPDLELAGEAANGRDALAVVAGSRPDVVVTDLRMPGGEGAVLIADLRARYPQLPIMVLSTFGSRSDVTAAMGAGATSYLLKDAARHELFDSVRATARGESVLAPAVATALVEAYRTPPPLSPREREILVLVARGSANHRIARELGISETTVKTHLARLYAKLEVPDRASAVAVAYRRGWISDEEGQNS